MAWLTVLIDKGKNCEQKYTRIGIFYAALGAVVLSLSTLLIKLVGDIPFTQLIFIRSTLLLLQTSFFIQSFSIAAYFKSVDINRKLMYRSINSFVLAVTKVISVRILPLSEFQVISSMSPLFTGVGGSLFMNEKLTAPLIVSFGFCFGGMVFIARPAALFPGSEQEDNPYVDNTARVLGMFLAVINAANVATSSLIGRSLSKTVENITMFHYNAAMMSLVSAVAMIGQDAVIPNTEQMCYLLLQGVVEFIGRWGITRALRFEKAIVVSLVMYLGIVASIMADVFILSISLNGFTILGTVLILGSVLYLSFMKKR